jgi:hypothetical protein
MQQVQQCIERHGWPVKIGGPDDPRWTRPLDGVAKTLGLPVVFKGEAIELEANFVTLSPAQPYAWTLDLDRPPDLETSVGKMFVFRPHSEFKFKPVDINERLASLGADVRFSYGDRVLSLTFRMNKKEWQAGFYILAGMIKCFGGYGFDFYHSRSGTLSYADSLIEEATKIEEATWPDLE